MQAAEEVHGKASYFAKRGEFPAFKNSEIEESNEAIIYMKREAPLLMKYMPFWLGEFANRMFFYLLPFFVLSRPIIMGVLSYRLSQGRVRINAVYKELLALEKQIVSVIDHSGRVRGLEKLDEIHEVALSMKIPRELYNEYFLMRANIDELRRRLTRLDPLNARRSDKAQEDHPGVAPLSDADIGRTGRAGRM